jgi:hypothetical protein
MLYYLHIINSTRLMKGNSCVRSSAVPCKLLLTTCCFLTYKMSDCYVPEEANDRKKRAATFKNHSLRTIKPLAATQSSCVAKLWSGDEQGASTLAVSTWMLSHLGLDCHRMRVNRNVQTVCCVHHSRTLVTCYTFTFPLLQSVNLRRIKRAYSTCCWTMLLCKLLCYVPLMCVQGVWMRWAENKMPYVYPESDLVKLVESVFSFQ